MLYRRVGFLATLAAGAALLGASFHGITSVDDELKLAAATPAPATTTESVNDRRGRDCDRHDGGGRHHGGPEV
ncbi:hypothetical protein [Solirubrobacter soli]|uniref:hypothetical protein n=1 Tax=Solirubrobacter soli TaxID=363832 RepID=UPI0004024E80|nr:hypothetical protein [Solirubrobacter soli]